MKKRNLFLALVMSLVMMLTACGNSNPFVGTWRGTCDLTDYIVELMVADEPDMAKYVEFEDLKFEVIFEFTEDGEVEIYVDEDSVDEFVENVEDGMYNMMDKMFEEQLAEMGVTKDYLAAYMGYDSYDAMMYDMIAAADMKGTMSGMFEVFELEGTYEYDEEDGELTIEYDDEDAGDEEFEYEFEDGKLYITAEADGEEFVFECEKED